MEQRAEQAELKRTQVGPRKKVKDANLESRYTDPIRNNKLLRDCCRDVDTSEVYVSKTHEGARTPDLMIIECDCGRKQYRAAVGPGRVGGGG